MVLIAATVITKSGRPLVTRQYVADMSRARLEGLIDAIPKLIGTSGSSSSSVSKEDKSKRQHTFVETDSVRYVYQPLDNVYMVLVTTKASNILEDLETLRLFARVLPEYYKTCDEAEIREKAFDLIFAFDEIVVLGYRESVNLAQIRTFTEMDSHEERVYNQIQIAQQRAATNAMNEKVKEMKRAEKQRKNLLRQGLTPSQVAAIAGGVSGSATGTTAFASSGPTTVSAFSSDFPSKSKPYKSAVPAGGGKALKLGGKAGADENSFLAQLRQEGQEVTTSEKMSKLALDSGDAAAGGEDLSAVSKSPVHLKCIEKITASATRDGALESGEILGSVTLLVSDPKYQCVAIRVKSGEMGIAQLQVHPNLDKKVWQAESLLRLKSEQKPYPVGADVGVLKWRLALANEEALPLAQSNQLSVNVWPNESPEGVTVNIEYSLQREALQLQNVTIAIPLPPATAPVVSECDGAYEYVKSKSLLLWHLLVVDESNKTGTLEFSTPNGHADHFFPVTVRFHSEQLYCPVTVDGVQEMNGSEDIENYSVETRLVTEKYEVV